MREFEPNAQHSDLFANDYTSEENRQFAQQFGEITQLMAEQMQAGAAVTDGDVQNLIRRHYEFCCQFWKPTRESYTSLALSYVLPSPYRNSYEGVFEGLGKFHYDAIVVWANENLE